MSQNILQDLVKAVDGEAFVVKLEERVIRFWKAYKLDKLDVGINRTVKLIILKQLNHTRTGAFGFFGIFEGDR